MRNTCFGYRSDNFGFCSAFLEAIFRLAISIDGGGCILDLVEAILVMLVLRVEEAHVARDANQHVLRNVDLHEDKQLVKGAKDIADWGQVDPLVTMHAEQMLVSTGFVLPVDDEVAGGDSEN